MESAIYAHIRTVLSMGATMGSARINGINPAYLNEMFTVLNSEYNFRNQSRLDQPKFNTKTFGYKSFNYFGAKIWNLIPTHTKSTDDLSIFRSNIYKWCQTEYAQNVLDQIGLW